MPHDKNGALLKEGDEVVIRARIKSISSNVGFCNATLVTSSPIVDDDGKPVGYENTLTINTNQCEKVEPNAAPAASATPADAGQSAS